MHISRYFKTSLVSSLKGTGPTLGVRRAQCFTLQQEGGRQVPRLPPRGMEQGLPMEGRSAAAGLGPVQGPFQTSH